MNPTFGKGRNLKVLQQQVYDGFYGGGLKLDGTHSRAKNYPNSIFTQFDLILFSHDPIQIVLSLWLRKPPKDS